MEALEDELHGAGDRGGRLVAPGELEDRLPQGGDRLDEGRLVGHPVLEEIGRIHKASAAQVALAFLLTRPGVIAIPKSGSPDRVRENFRAAEIRLTSEDLRLLDEAFPPPTRKRPLEMI